jgi:hypothetical protein
MTAARQRWEHRGHRLFTMGFIVMISALGLAALLVATAALGCEMNRAFAARFVITIGAIGFAILAAGFIAVMIATEWYRD